MGLWDKRRQEKEESEDYEPTQEESTYKIELRTGSNKYYTKKGINEAEATTEYQRVKEGIEEGARTIEVIDYNDDKVCLFVSSLETMEIVEE